jgi:hypothetical protein
MDSQIVGYVEILGGSARLGINLMARHSRLHTSTRELHRRHQPGSRPQVMPSFDDSLSDSIEGAFFST